MHQQMPINCHYNKKIGEIMNYLSGSTPSSGKNFNVGFFSFGPKDN